MNKWVLKELLPIHCTKKNKKPKPNSQLSGFPSFTILLQSWGSECSQEVVLTRQLRLRKGGGGGLRGQDRRELACWVGRTAQGRQRLSLRALHAPRPPTCPPPPAKGGETRQKARPRDWGCAWGGRLGRGAGERDWFQGWEQLGSRWGRGGGRCH